MRTKLSVPILLFLLFGFSNISNAQNVNIPDSNFKALLVDNLLINTNVDGEIQVAEAIAFTDTIVADNNNISDIKGIEAFTSLSGFNCAGNKLTSLDLSGNKELRYLDCSVNQLSTLDISANRALQILNCDWNKLTSLDLSSNPALQMLSCYDNQLTSLDLSANKALIRLNCVLNQLKALDVSKNTALSVLNCSFNQISRLDFSSNTALEYLVCSSNFLTTLDVASNNSLKGLVCNFNNIANLNISLNKELNSLECAHNLLTSLDISANTALILLWCFDNQLTSLNVKNGNNTELILFSTRNNPHLNCIQADDVGFLETHFSRYVDSWTSFSETCTFGVDNILHNKVNIFPNPSSGIFTISGLPMGALCIDIYNVLGENVYSRNNTQTVSNIDISNSPKGMYFVKISDGENVYTTKIEIR